MPLLARYPPLSLCPRIGALLTAILNALESYGPVTFRSRPLLAPRRLVFAEHTYHHPPLPDTLPETTPVGWNSRWRKRLPAISIRIISYFFPDFPLGS